MPSSCHVWSYWPKRTKRCDITRYNFLWSGQPAKWPLSEWKTDAVLWILVKNFFRNLSKWVRGPEDSKFTMCQLVCCNLILLMLVYRHNVTRAECIRFWPWCYWSTLIQHLYWAALVTVCCWLSVWYHCVSGWKITPITLQIAIHTENIEG